MPCSSALRRAAVLSSHAPPPRRRGGWRGGSAAAAAADAGGGWAAGMGEAAAARVQRAGLEVALVPCLSDNYCPVLRDPRPGGATLVVDTPDAAAIIAELRRRDWAPTHIINTHHHGDHVGGNAEIVAAYPGIQVVGPHDVIKGKYTGPWPKAGEYDEKIPQRTQAVGDGDTVKLGLLDARVLSVGGHTHGHIAYFLPEVPLVFAGDALFTLGCGRVFTGDFAKMTASMQKLRALPPETVVYCAHEYTESNAKFAVGVETGNADLLARCDEIARIRRGGGPTVPTLLGDELRTNPFLRYDAPGVIAASGLPNGRQDAVSVFTYVRRWKDGGKRPKAA